MLLEPVFDVTPFKSTCRNIKHQSLLLVCFGYDLETVENEEDFHRRVRHSLVAVEKGMMHGKRVSECRRFASSVT